MSTDYSYINSVQGSMNGFALPMTPEPRVVTAPRPFPVMQGTRILPIPTWLSLEFLLTYATTMMRSSAGARPGLTRESRFENHVRASH